MEMVNRSIEVKHICLDCQLNLSKIAKFYDNVDVLDRLIQKAKKESCIICHKEMGMPTFIKCEIAGRLNNCYKFWWKCMDCKTLWCSIENVIKPNDVNYHLEKAAAKMCCINDNCKSTNFVCVSFQLVHN